MSRIVANQVKKINRKIKIVKKVKVFWKIKIVKKANKAKNQNKNRKTPNLYQVKYIKNLLYYPPPQMVP